MNIHPIKTDRDYQRALARIEVLMDADVDTVGGEELDILATLVDAYEAKHFPIDPPDPVEAILFRMEQMGLDRKDLEPILGGKSRVSEVLNRKRGLSITQIKRLHSSLQIPFENLLGENAA
jgi:HTH-type transcriptional regulator / antitoxin HigA